MDIRVKIRRTASPDFGKIITLPLEEYIRGVVPGEMKASSYHDEALKAQAVAARTYAMRYIKSRTGYQYDLDDTSNRQVYCPYDRSRGLNPRADKAVEATAGQFLTYNGKLATVFFTHANGGRTVSHLTWQKKDLPYLPEKDDPYDDSKKVAGHGVGLSQVGANNAAKRGLSYKDILSFYYPGTILSKNISEPVKPKATKSVDGIGTYSATKEGGKLLSKNFTVREFRCKDGSDEVKVADDLIVLLQKIRDHFGKPVNIISGYRTQSYNNRCNGARQSKHMTGEAADIQVRGITAKEVALYAESIGVGGVGAYLYGFVHVDCRKDKKVRWIRETQAGKDVYVTKLAGRL